MQPKWRKGGGVEIQIASSKLSFGMLTSYCVWNFILYLFFELNALSLRIGLLFFAKSCNDSCKAQVSYLFEVKQKKTAKHQVLFSLVT